jgi:adenine-specific DNA-methyltransferase
MGHHPAHGISAGLEGTHTLEKTPFMSPTDFSAIAAVSSPDHNAERLAALKQLFPDLFTNEGRLNVDELKKVVDPKLVSETERYDFRWYGKTASKREAFTPSRAALVCDQARSVNPAKAGGNMIIEGENLEVLKLLSSAYRERIKCIYIDPPYNTGKDFVYSDRFAEGQRPYWEQTGVTEGGVKVDTNTDSDGRFHSNWLSMMHSRLLVARYLLRPDGVIFVSIGYHEFSNLKRLMDEVFGEECFAGLVTWKARVKPVNIGPAKVRPQQETEYVLVYEKSGSDASFHALYSGSVRSYPFELSGRKYRTATILKSNRGVNFRSTMSFPLGDYTPPEGQRWQAGEDEIKTLSDTGYIEFKEGTPFRRYFEDEEGAEHDPFYCFMEGEWSGTSEVGKHQLNELLGDQHDFDTVKPTRLLHTLFQASTKENDLILDFFGGSGTTAQAVMELNKADGGNRQFILVQLPELTAADSPAHKAGYKKISDITIERSKRVIQKLEKEEKAKEPTLFPKAKQEELLRVAEDPPVYGAKPKADGLGFKVFKLGKSHFPRVEFAPDPDKTEAENIELLKQYIRDKEATFHIQWERETVLDEVLLKNGFMLDYTLTPRPEFTKNEVFLAKDAHKESLICLDPNIAPETVDHFKKHPEPFFICLELALDTTKKWNLKHHLGDKLKAF